MYSQPPSAAETKDLGEIKLKTPVKCELDSHGDGFVLL